MTKVELRVLCEGQTEINFVTQVLGPHLRPHRVFAKAQRLPSGGGVVAWGTLRKFIQNEVGRSRSHQFVTTMIDLYALPQDYPEQARQPGESGAQRAVRIQAGMKQAVPNPRFLPYLQVHEFEALVLVDVAQLPSQFPDGEARHAAEQLRGTLGSTAPEDVDDGIHTAPSKRIELAVPAYERLKPIAGPAIAARIGVAGLRAACPHFDAWVTRLESLRPDLHRAS